MTSTKLIALITVLAFTAMPALSFARASGGGGGGRGSGGFSKGSSAPGSVGSRGSRTYDNNANKPIERSTVPQSSPGGAPAAARPAPAVPAQPLAQPPFWQRHPILTGLAAGLAGSWIGHMLFGANNSLAAEGEATGSNAGSFFNLFVLLLIGAAGVYFFMRFWRTPNTAAAYSGLSSASVRSTTIPVSSLPDGSHGTIQSDVAAPMSSENISTFSQMLRDVQAAWSRQDLDMLKRLATPEMLHYFSSTLAENASREVENHVEDVTVLSAQVQEAWQEDQTEYATVLLRWTARDYDVALNKARSDSGSSVDGNEQTSTEVSEAWTFMRYRQGKWLLSAIQQVE